MRIATLLLIFLLLSGAWLSMGLAVKNRHDSQNRTLARAVSRIWGSAHCQGSPRLLPQGQVQALPLDSSTVAADLRLEQKRKGLFWFSTYFVTFEGRYRFTNRSNHSQLDFVFPLPALDGMYSDFEVTAQDAPLPHSARPDNLVVVPLHLEPGKTTELTVRYSSQGSDTWRYSFGSGSPTRDLDLTLTTNFTEIDFPDDTVSPNARRLEGDGWTLTWIYRNLLHGGQVGMTLPQLSDTGPRLLDICLYAPAGLLLFLVTLLTLAVTRNLYLQPVQLVLLSCGYFSFHLLLLYLGDALPLLPAFGLASAVAIFVNVSYAQRIADRGFALKTVGGSMLLYLVLFSAAFLTESYRGLSLTFLVVFTLFLIMQVTAEVDWDELAGREIRE